jgi:uncharacterized membrane protein
MFEELLELYEKRLAEKEKDLRGYQAMIQLVTTIEKMSQESLSPHGNVALLRKLEDQVSRQSRELRDLRAELVTGKEISPPMERQKSKALDGHAWNLIDLLREKQGSCTTNELVEMLGLNKTTVISVMKRAVALDPDHLKLTTGKRRKLYLAYVP